MRKQLVVLASNNAGKAKEINELLAGSEINVISQSDFNVPEAEEVGLSFIENAIIKARNAAQYCQHPVIADDSGIEVDILNGQPGIYSARYAGVNASDEENLNKLIQAIDAYPDNTCTARFVCVMVYLKHKDDPRPIIAEGLWEGTLLKQPHGENGFGYDPMFYVPTHKCASAELLPEVKNQLSHRGQALRKLISIIS